MKYKFSIFFFFFFAFSAMATAQLKHVLNNNIIQIKIEPELLQYLQVRSLEAEAGQPLSLGIRSLDALNQQYGVRSMRRIFPYARKYENKHQKFGLHLWYEVVFNESVDVESAASSYEKDDYVAIANPFHEIKLVDDCNQSIPNSLTQEIHSYSTTDDPSLSRQWHYNNPGTLTRSVAGADIRLFEAWNITMGAPNVIVAIVDGGIDFTHEDIAANMWKGLGGNFVSGGLPTPDDHGTHVAGTVAAVNNNGKGGAGVAGGTGSGDGVRLMSCQILEDGKKATSVTVPNAIVYAADSGAVILQNSWGYQNPNVYNPPDKVAIDYFIQNAGTDEYGAPLPNTPMKGGIVIFAAGNDNSNGIWYPAAFPEVLSVAAIGPDGQRAPYSNYADWVDISAPGGATDATGRGVYSTIPNNGYGYKQGTSMACPHVSGVAALVLSKYGHPSFTPDSLWVRLLHEPTSLEQWDAYYAPAMGVGLINTVSALAPYVKVSGVTLSNTQYVQLGRTIQFVAIIQPANAFDKSVAWASTDPSIAKVDMKGNVTGISEGVTTITATTNDGGYVASCQVTVVKIYVSGVTLDHSYLDIELGKMGKLIANLHPANANDQTVTWNSNNSSIATVNNTGIVTGVNVGRTFITVTANDGGFKDTCYVTVVKPVTGVSIYPTNVHLKTGGIVSLEAIIEPGDAGNKKVIWQSNNTSIAIVDTNGIVKGISGGTESNPKKATIKVTTENGGHTATAQVNVYESIHAPEGFSPNGDGVNDCFEMTLDSKEIYSLRIFDKSGQIYYESSDYKNDWDGVANTGAMKGKKVLPGSYFYVATAKSGSTKKGYVVVRY